MTREEAIDELKKLIPICRDCAAITKNCKKYGTYIRCRNRRDALLLAIEALKQPEQRWVPCSEHLPDEDHWLGGSGKQFSEKVLVTIVNHDDDDIWVDTTQTIDGEWMLELPRYCKITAWMELPKPYREDKNV